MIQGLFHWGGHAITVDSVVPTQDLITEIIKEWEVQREKQMELEQEQWLIKRKSTRMPATNDWDSGEGKWGRWKRLKTFIVGQCQHWMENIILLSVSQVKINWVSKFSAPLNLLIFSGQEQVLSTERSIDQWLFKVEGALATHTEEAVRSAVIRVSKATCSWVIRAHRLWRRNEWYIETY